MFQFERVLRHTLDDFEKRSPSDNLNFFINKYVPRDGKLDQNYPDRSAWAGIMYNYRVNPHTLIRIETRFAKALNNQNDIMKHFTFSCIPEYGSLVMEFPGMPLNIFKGDKKYITTGCALLFAPDEITDVKTMTVIAFNSDKVTFKVTFALDYNNFQDAFDDFIDHDGLTNPEFFQFIAKVLFYLGTDYNFEEIKSPVINTKNPIKIRKKIQKSDYLFSHKLLSWMWKNPPNYEKNEWQVSGFFRVQPYGPELSLRKLIWVDAHKRKRKKPTADTEPHDASMKLIPVGDRIRGSYDQAPS